jgi:hypothetical protein
MIPTLLLIGAGKHRRIWLPLPMFLLWPFWLLGWLVWLPLWVIRLRAEVGIRAALLTLGRLSGTLVDVEARDGTRIYFRFI